MKKFLSGILSLSLLLLSACTPNQIRLSRHCKSSTVVVHVKFSMMIDKKEKKGIGTCAGVYISPTLILTAAHCTGIYDPDIKVKEIWIRNVYDESASATLIKLDRQKDLALLRTNLRGSAARLARNVKVGEDCYVVGNPLGLEFVVSKGIVSSVNVETLLFPISHFLTDATILPGNSGGPAFNSHGQLMGIVVMSTSMMGAFGAAGLGFVVQIDEVKDFLRHIK